MKVSSQGAVATAERSAGAQRETAVVAEERGRKHEFMGARLREARMRSGLGVRELARQLEISASLVSQIELGRVAPSVSTLYALTNALNVSMDSLFVDEEDEPPPEKVTGRARTRIEAVPHEPSVLAHTEPSPSERAFVQRRSTRSSIDLEKGVRWELLTPAPEPGAEFLEVHYAVGGSSSPTDGAIRHNGRDYCLILEGVLSIQIGFEQLTLRAGDSLAFDATIPHRFWNEGPSPVRAVWFVLDRFGS